METVSSQQSSLRDSLEFADPAVMIECWIQGRLFDDALLLAIDCRTASRPAVQVGKRLPRRGDAFAPLLEVVATPALGSHRRRAH